jgi:hypothetical protein
VSKHIKLLHRYNEAKDAAQVILKTRLPSVADSDAVHPDSNWEGASCSSSTFLSKLIFSQLAAHKETTIRQMHEEYGLTDDD